MLATMKSILQVVLIVAALFSLSGCSSIQSRSQKLHLDMTKSAAIELMGSDYTTVAAREEPDGTSVSVLQYQLKKNQPLFLYFRQDKLVQWGDVSVLNAMPPAGKTN